MRRRSTILAFTVVCLAAALTASSTAKPMLPLLFGEHAGRPALVFVYHGWRIDASGAAGVQSPDKTIRLTKAQLELVEASGLSPPVLAVMRAVPIVVVPGGGADAAYYSHEQGVTVYARRLDKTKPTMLRELLAAYYDRAMPQSAAVDIYHFRREILAKRVWPKSAAMLRDDRDYFAITAAAYLNGAITREPYNRANLRDTQPGYYDWLARLFDGGRARS